MSAATDRSHSFSELVLNKRASVRERKCCNLVSVEGLLRSLVRQKKRDSSPTHFASFLSGWSKPRFSEALPKCDREHFLKKSLVGLSPINPNRLHKSTPAINSGQRQLAANLTCSSIGGLAPLRPTCISVQGRSPVVLRSISAPDRRPIRCRRTTRISTIHRTSPGFHTDRDTICPWVQRYASELGRRLQRNPTSQTPLELFDTQSRSIEICPAYTFSLT
jgi:hypothetical protein